MPDTTLLEPIKQELIRLTQDEAITVEDDVPLSALGVDSLLRVALLDRLESIYAVDLESAELAPESTLIEIAAEVQRLVDAGENG